MSGKYANRSEYRRRHGKPHALDAAARRPYRGGRRHNASQPVLYLGPEVAERHLRIATEVKVYALLPWHRPRAGVDDAEILNRAELLGLFPVRPIQDE